MTCDLRAVSCTLFLVLIAGIIAPAAAGDDPAGPPVVLTVVSPKPNGTAWIDVVPPHVAVVGRVDAAYGVRGVTVESSVGGVSCGNGTDFACSVPVAEGNETITVTAVDTQGNAVEAVLNLTIRIGLPPPPLIAVSGMVTDIAGRPVPGASVRFESVTDTGRHPAFGGGRDR